MNERMKEALERTQMTLCRHLEDLNDQVDQDGGRIRDHMVLDGIKDSTKSLTCIKNLMGESNGDATGNGVAFQKTKAPSLM